MTQRPWSFLSRVSLLWLDWPWYSPLPWKCCRTLTLLYVPPFLYMLYYSLLLSKYDITKAITEILQCFSAMLDNGSGFWTTSTIFCIFPLFCLYIFITPFLVLLSSFSLLHPLYTDQNLEFHWHTVRLSQSDKSHHGNCAEPCLHFTLHPSPSIISLLWRSQVEEGRGRGVKISIQSPPLIIKTQDTLKQGDTKKYHITTTSVCH